MSKIEQEDNRDKIIIPRPSDKCPVIMALQLSRELSIRSMSHRQFARLSGVSRNTIGQLCSYPVREVFDNRTISAIAYALELPFPGVLFEFVDKDQVS